jgi:hypothetical protein
VGSLLIPNCEGGHGCRANGTGTGGQTSRIPGYNGIMEELFGLYGQLPNQTDPFNGKEPMDGQSIASLAKINNATALSQINWTGEEVRARLDVSCEGVEVARCAHCALRIVLDMHATSAVGQLLVDSELYRYCLALDYHHISI